METLLKCPICSSTNLESVMQIPDHFLTNEIFSISKCLQCGFLFTNPKPLKTDIPKYYQSDD
jgi:C4-type Zn-finger protein